MPKFKIITLGCKVNQAESESIAEDLLSSQWLAIQDQEVADVCIINTCTVTQKASMQSRQAVRRAIRANPTAQIVVAGCYAQIAPEEIESIEGVNYVVGHSEKRTIGSMMRCAGEGSSELMVSSCGDIDGRRPFESMSLAVRAPRTRPLLKIQDGCDAFCTYCVVPYARGRSRSMPLNNVLKCIARLAEAGYREVVITGVHLGVYGHDLAPSTSLSMLIDGVHDLKPIERIRLSSIEPLELNEKILQRVAKSNIFCRHFHIPLQSGDDGILKRMGRPYSRRIFHDLIMSIHALMTDAAIGVDILVGFPGESDEAFENTYELIERLPVSYLHVFPFSPRPGTAADKFSDKIPPNIIKNRCKRMRALGNTKRMKFYQKFTGQTLSILVESKKDVTTGWLKGISSNYLPVLIDAGDDQQNKIIEVKIEKLKDRQLIGRIKVNPDNPDPNVNNPIIKKGKKS